MINHNPRMRFRMVCQSLRAAPDIRTRGSEEEKSQQCPKKSRNLTGNGGQLTEHNTLPGETVLLLVQLAADGRMG